MINYEPFWATLKEKEITKYQLIYHWGISSNTLRRMKHNEAISSTTLNELCLILDCNISQIMHFNATTEELDHIEKKRMEIKSKAKNKKS
ncbi:MAG: helix-turn-helix transcriptional regulator [Agathobacter sp.]|nr:helix-turn-helix transcriptional regulator [Agathobacter sp.]